MAKKSKKRRRKTKVRRKRSNPGVRGLTSGLTAGFKPKVLEQAGLMTVGIIGNIMMTGLAASRLPLPSFLTSGWGRSVLGLVNAGLIGSVAGMVSKKNSGMIFSGAVVQVVGDLAKSVMPGVLGMAGLGDFLTADQESQATSIDGNISGLGNMRGTRRLADFLTSEQENQATSIDGSISGLMGFGDFSQGSLM